MDLVCSAESVYHVHPASHAPGMLTADKEIHMSLLFVVTFSTQRLRGFVSKFNVAFRECITTCSCYCLVLVTRDDPEWYMAESLITGQRGFIPFNFVAASNTMETESYVIQEICTPFHTLYKNRDTPSHTMHASDASTRTEGNGCG
jgi:hypothetical protein